MSISKRIVEFVEQNPGVTADIIGKQCGISDQTCKATLWRLWGAKKVVREKVKVSAPRGPQSLYAYFTPEKD